MHEMQRHSNREQYLDTVYLILPSLVQEDMETLTCYLLSHEAHELLFPCEVCWTSNYGWLIPCWILEHCHCYRADCHKDAVMEDEVDLTTLCMPIRSSGARGMLWVDLPVLRMSRSTLIQNVVVQDNYCQIIFTLIVS